MLLAERVRTYRILALAVAGTLITSATLIAAGSAQAREVYPRPAGDIVVISGHGFGHGHGMSQWGAYGAAASGRLSWQGILSFYYPGTRLANLGDPTIRVRLDAVGSGPLSVFNVAGLRLGGRALPSATAGVSQFRARSLSTAGRLQVDALSPAGWRPYASLVSPAVFASASGLVDVKLADGTRRGYRGLIVANRATPSSITAVSVLPMESYLRAVVPVEMPASWPSNALRAQAVSARSYAGYDRAHAGPGQTWDTCDTTSCQVYSGASAEYRTSNAAVAATAGQTLTSGGAPAFTQFGAADGGWTAAGSQPYLPAKADPYDGAIPNSANSWTASFTVADIQARWPSIGTFGQLRILSRDGHGQWGGRVLTAAIDGSRGSVALTGATIRSAFGLLSEWFVPINPPPVQGWATTRYTSYRAVVLRQGSSGAAVAVLQLAIKVTPDGDFGPLTRDALMRFEKLATIPANGIANPLVWDRLQSRDYPLIAYRLLTLRQGATGRVVVVLQRALRMAPTGVFGQTTTAAVKAIQARAKITQTGVVMGWTWVAIENRMPR